MFFYGLVNLLLFLFFEVNCNNVNSRNLLSTYVIKYASLKCKSNFCLPLSRTKHFKEEIGGNTLMKASFLTVCKRNDPHLNECVKKSVEKLRPLLSKGIPEFGIPSCEPLRIPEVIIDQGNGPVSVKSSYKNIKIFGPSEFVLKNIKIDLEKNRVHIKLWLPRLELQSEYTMDGKILMLPIKGSGTSKGNYTNIDITIIMQGQQIKKDTKAYLNIKDFYVDFNIGHATIQLDNLFNGDKELGEAMNLFLNDNWKQVASEIKPILEDTIATIFKKFTNKIFHKYPLDVLLP